MNSKFTLLLAILFFTLSANSQLTVNNGHTGQELANILAGENITATNVSISGNSQQYGSFTFSGEGLDVNSGVILSTGNIFDAIGPNNDGGTSTDFGGPGNSLLTELSGSQTHDAVVLQFDFEVQSDEIEFNFNFLSEEYNEYVGSQFNDVFAFFISGPGITGEENLAVVPGTTTPVSINTINNDQFWQFYHDNTNGNTDVEFDGYTTLMTAKKDGLQSCETYTLKLMLADAGDGIFDAGVLLQENSLVQANISASSSTYSDNNTALEGCIEADFTFQLDEAVDYDVEIPLTIGGTAINGVDYKHIDPIIVIPAGQTSATIIIESYSDGTTEGQEIIEISYIPAACQAPQTISLFIDDFQPIEFTATETGANCNGASDGEVLFNITGGFAPYIVNLTDTNTLETLSYTENPIIGISGGTYSVEIIDSYGCKAEDIVFGDVFNAGTTFLPTGTGVTYETSIDVTGFSEGETLETIDQFKQVSATMEHSYANDLSITLRAPNGTEVLLKAEGDGWIGSNPNNSCDMGEPVASGRVDEWNADNITPGIGYEYVWNLDPTYGTMTHQVDNQLLPEHTYISTFGNELTDFYYPTGSYEPEGNLTDFIGTELNGTWTIIVTDFYILDNGYIFEWSLSVSSPQSDSIITISEPELPIVTSTFTEPNCGGSNGEIDISVSGVTPTDFLWNTGATTEDIAGLISGSYSVNITGDNSCDYDYDFNLSDNGSLALTAIPEPETCVDADNGSIDLTVAGGTEPFTYSWDNGSTDEDISNLTPGNYTVTVNDNGNCSAIETFEVEEAVNINISANITDENCGDEEGIINITLTGGVEPYSFIWSTGATSEDIDELAQGSYTVTVTDSNGCTSQETFSVTNYVGNCIPDCDLAITNSIVTDETCGQANGEIDLTIFTSFSPYEISWSNGSTTDVISNLSANNYTITITDAEGCELIETYTINNDAGTLSIINTESTNETCGNGQGAIDITLNGGALPYSYNWSNGASTEDINNVSEGSYNVIVSDANGCSVSANAEVTNEAGTLSQTWGNSMNETCGNNEGSVDILIEGGNPFGGGGGGFPGFYNYLWSNGSTTEDLINIGEGSYSCVVTDEDGCHITTPVYIIENEAGDLNIDDIDLDNEICSNAEGEIEIIISGGTTPYNFNWSNGETTQDIFNLSAGNYIGTITDDNGCTVNTGTLTLINETGTLALTDINTTDELCNNNSGAIDITIEGGATPYYYLWNTGSTSEDLNGISEGNYSCNITDSNGCIVNVNTTIENDNGTIAVSNTVVTDETCGNSNGEVDITITGAATPISFNWNSGETTEDIIGISAGNYNCIITDNIGCQTEANAIVDNNSGTLSLDNSIITNEQCGAADGSINILVSGTDTPYTYNWSNGETTEDLSNLSAGVYSCVITDNAGCSVYAGPFTINNTSTAMSVDNIITTDETCGSGNGSIDITITGGTEPIDYIWSNGETTQDIFSISAGTYNYTITDATGCSISGSAEITNNAGDLSIDSHLITNEICTNGNGGIDITVSGAEPLSYVWSNGGTSQDLTGINAGTYSVVVTDDNGCEITSDTYNVLNDPGAFSLVSLNTVDEVCGNATGSISVELENGTAPISYAWNNGATNEDLTNLSEGVYTCLATDVNGCELNYSGTIQNQNGNLQVSDVIVTDETCNEENGTIDITVSGGNSPYNFSWNNGETTEDLTDISSGTYTCLITDDQGCTTNTNAEVGDIGGDFSIIGFEITNEHCDNNEGEINLIVTGGTSPYTYLWNNGATTQDITNLSEGNYNVNVTDDFGCEIESSGIVLNIEGVLIIDNAIVTDETCGNQNGAIDITYSGAEEPAMFMWSNGETTEDLISLSTGNYELTITDGFGCFVTENYFVDNVTNGIALQNSSITNESCGNSAGTIDLTITGGEEPYTFSWSNGANTEDITNLSSGNYTCIVTDNTGCSITVSETVLNITNGTTINLEGITNDECTSGNGSININASGGESPYSYLWNTGATSEDLNNITPGIYFVTITDNTGCSTTSENYIVENEENEDIAIVNIQTQPDFCGFGEGSINYEAAVSGSYTYELNGTPGTPPFQFLVAGEYTISIINGNCRADEIVTVGSEGFFNLNVDNVQNEVCGQQNGLIEITASGGGGGGGSFNYNWSNGETTQDIYNLEAGEYSCEILHVNSGCLQTLSETISNTVSFNASHIKTDATCGNSNGAIDLTIEPAGTYTYNWSNGADTEDITELSAGLYTCTISDTEGCEDIITEEIFDNINDIDISADVQDNICGEFVGSIDLTITGAPMGTSVLWNTGATTNFLHNIEAGNYSVTVTDLEFGCEEFRDYDIIDLPAYSISEIITNSSCVTCDDGEIDLSPNPSGTYTYDWSNGANTEDISDLLPGDYSVLVSNENGCEFEETYTVEYSNSVNPIENILLTAYPNPTDDILKIEYKSINEKTTIRIFNTIGILLYDNVVSSNEGTIEVDISNYSAGVYFLSAGNNKQKKTIKIFKQNK